MRTLMRSRTLSIAFTCCALVGAPLLSTTSAVAQGDSATEMARQRFQEGVTFFDQGKYEKARAAFLQAYALKKHPDVLLNLAQSELRSGHEADAATHFAQYLRENPDAPPAKKQEAEIGLTASKAKVAEVAVQVDKSGAEVFVDGESRGKAPLEGPIYLAPGNHTLEARDGGQTATAQVTATAGQSTTAQLTLAAPAGGGGAVPPAGGPAAGGTPPAEGGGTSGSASFAADTSGERKPFPEWFMDQKIAWIGAGVAGVGLLGGVVFALSSSSAYSSADDTADLIRREAAADGISGPCNPANTVSLPTARRQSFSEACASYEDDVDAGDSRKTLSTVFFVVGGLAAAGTAAFYFFDPEAKVEKGAGAAKAKSHGPRAGIVPALGPESGGLFLVGQF